MKQNEQKKELVWCCPGVIGRSVLVMNTNESTAKQGVMTLYSKSVYSIRINYDASRELRKGIIVKRILKPGR